MTPDDKSAFPLSAVLDDEDDDGSSPVGSLSPIRTVRSADLSPIHTSVAVAVVKNCSVIHPLTEPMTDKGQSSDQLALSS